VNPEEYEKLEQVERKHWFYAGKREIVRHWLSRVGALRPEAFLVDCGAGTGRFAAEMVPHCKVVAIDDHAESLAIARKNLGDDRVLEGSCLKLPLPDSTADIVTALDVIEHVEDDHRAVREMTRVMKPGGVLVITVPAFQELWSDWDEALHHYRRYRRAGLERCLQGANMDIMHIAYINVLAFPAVFAIRKLRRMFPEPQGAARAEENIPPAWLNQFLQATFVGLACQSAVRFPFGVGLLAVAKKPALP
jgi:SAM-dependent methyltransferase